MARMAGRRAIIGSCEVENCAAISSSRFVTSKPVSAGFDEACTEVTIADAVDAAEVFVLLER